MTEKLVPDSEEKDLGETWMLTNGTVMSNVDAETKAAIIREVEFAHLYFLDIINILKIDGNTAGMIIEKEFSTLTIAHLVEDHGLLASAEGEWIEGRRPCLEYCLARI
ncbi:MAG: hypothetical protein ACRCXD_19090 [Luteolibacter sp.]